MNDKLPWGDWTKLNFERWKRQRHTLVLKASIGFTHSTVDERYGYGNSYGRVNYYDRFTSGGMMVSGLGTYTFDGPFLGYEKYSLQGETMVILGADYRFPILREIDVGWWAFYFDKMYFAFFGDVGNLWAHVDRQKDQFNFNKVFDANGDGKFRLRDDVLVDAGIELRMCMYLFNNGWDSFIKIAHGFNDHEAGKYPLRFYIGLGTGFDD
jgi:outer membrane protein assembly factor BamA